MRIFSIARPLNGDGDISYFYNRFNGTIRLEDAFGGFRRVCS